MFSKPIPKLILQIVLFLVTIVTTSLSGAEWIGLPVNSFEEAFVVGLSYSGPFLLILTVHEFGHFFTAKYYKVPVSLPYYIPVYFLGIMQSLGTMGAFIKMKPSITTTKQFFDIGIAGPLAGFIVALVFLFYGFTHLPPREHIFNVHKEYKQFGLAYENHVYNQTFLRSIDSLNHLKYVKNKQISEGEFQAQEHYEMMAVGDNLLFWLFKNYVAPDKSLVPNKYEMMHYPILFAGFLALFFTSLNLIPIGQLDGGHVLYGLIGYEKHKILAKGLFVLFVSYAALGFVRFNVDQNELIKNILLLGVILWVVFKPMFEDIKTVVILCLSVLVAELLLSVLLPTINGYTAWLFYSVILSRVLGIVHPRANIEMPLSTGRKILGWITLIIFILCFTPQPIMIE
jgi:membrane-associated protease RseP (regulator of RpoE activity)